jgi:hypothetical protein
MQTRFESQPFQMVRTINNFSPMNHGTTGLRERNDFTNIPNHFFRADKPAALGCFEKLAVPEREATLDRNRSSYLHAPVRKIWESDWTLLIPETHKENGNVF